tara:strand:- start:64 stop:1023 length:960 start_codon:yes stop_codon:yes gene_type:complete
MSFAKKKNKFFGEKFLDIPNINRKIHNKPTYLIGGHFIFVSYSFFYLLSLDYNLNQKLVFILVLSVIFIIGIIDDLKDLNPIKKTFYILFVYLTLVYLDNDYLLNKIYIETFEKNFNFGIYSYLISSLCILLLINAVNLIDGINGLAMMIFLIWSSFLYYFLNSDFNIFAFIFYLFIFFNIYKGRYFLGNSGSLIIGALIALSTIKTYNVNFIEKNSVEDIFILFLLPGIDMLRLFLQRIIKKQNPFKADNSHLHHLLIKIFSLQKVLFCYFVIIVVSSYAAFNDYLSEILIVSINIFIYISVLFLLNKKLSNKNDNYR